MQEGRVFDPIFFPGVYHNLHGHGSAHPGVHIVEGLAYREVFAEHLDGVTLYLNQEVPPCGQESQDKKNSKDGSWMLYIDQGYPSEYPVEQVIAISGGVLRAGLFLAKGEKNRHHNKRQDKGHNHADGRIDSHLPNWLDCSCQKGEKGRSRGKSGKQAGKAHHSQGVCDCLFPAQASLLLILKLSDNMHGVADAHRNQQGWDDNNQHI